MAEGLKVWIDQDLCTGDGICEEIAPDVFQVHDDGLAYVKERSWPNILGPAGVSVDDGKPAVRHGAQDTTSPDYVPLDPESLDAAVEAAEECPGECIFIEAEE